MTIFSFHWIDKLHKNNLIDISGLAPQPDCEVSDAAKIVGAGHNDDHNDYDDHYDHDDHDNHDNHDYKKGSSLAPQSDCEVSDAAKVVGAGKGTEGVVGERVSVQQSLACDTSNLVCQINFHSALPIPGSSL